MSASPVAWRIEENGAHLDCGRLQAFAVSAAENLGLLVRNWDGQAVSLVAVLCSRGPQQRTEPLHVAERFVRGTDLVECCSPVGPHRITPHIYWRASFADHLAAARIELVLSAQTELLDSVPTWTVESCVLRARRLYTSNLQQPQFENLSSSAKFCDTADSSEHLFVFRHEQFGFSYAQMVHPSDFVSANAPFDGTPHLLESTLFPEHLEKGVIRRGRICGWFMPAENDLETAVVLARQFVDEPLPLTA
jgi:hypothetical protein